jgi:hypothetical protein
VNRITCGWNILLTTFRNKLQLTYKTTGLPAVVAAVRRKRGRKKGLQKQTTENSEAFTNVHAITRSNFICTMFLCLVIQRQIFPHALHSLPLADTAVPLHLAHLRAYVLPNNFFTLNPVKCWIRYEAAMQAEVVTRAGLSGPYYRR